MRHYANCDIRYDAFDDHHLQRANWWQRAMRVMARRFAEVFSRDLENLLDDVECGEDILNNIDEGMRTIAVGADSLEQLVRRQKMEEMQAELDRDIDLGIVTMVGDVPIMLVDEQMEATMRKRAGPFEIKVRMSTRFVSECVVALRAVMGTPSQRTSAMNDSAESRMNKILRDINCRYEVINVNMPHILDAYFSCDAASLRTGAERGVLSRWLMRILNIRVAKPTGSC